MTRPNTMTLIETLKQGVVPETLLRAAKKEQVDAETLASDILAGHTVIMRNALHSSIEPLAIGKGLSVKINANIGSSDPVCDIEAELNKLKVAIKYGADTVMDLSTGGDLGEIRKSILATSSVPVGSVPIYGAAVRSKELYGSVTRMTADQMFHEIEGHAEDGMDFVTVHVGVNQKAMSALKHSGRVMDVVSRGGAFMIAWMQENDAENPLFADYGRLIEIAKKYELVLSLGDGMRPGCLSDASDEAQFTELSTLGELAKAALAEGVQVIIEGPGHVPLNQVEMNVRKQKELCGGAPFYVLGPLVTDIAPGYDHITGAIGGAIAAAAGADYLCYVTPREHLGLPDVEDVRQGVIASKIAAHAADIARGVKGAIETDTKMARARKNLDWKTQRELSLDPERAEEMHQAASHEQKECTMCGEFCSMKLMNECFNKDLLEATGEA